MIDHRAELEACVDPKYRDFMSGLIPGKEGVMGVRVPDLRRIAKRIIKDDWKSFLEGTPETYEEELLHCLVIATASMPTEERIARTEGFLPYVDNWATNDMFCQSWKFPKEDAEAVHSYFSSLIDSGDEFRMRVSLIMRMSHFMDDAHVDRLIEDILSHDNEGYYYRMGAAWALSVCYVHFPDRTEPAMLSDRLNDDVRRKALQKIRDSYRVDKADKDRLRDLVRQLR